MDTDIIEVYPMHKAGQYGVRVIDESGAVWPGIRIFPSLVRAQEYAAELAKSEGLPIVQDFVEN